MSWSLERVQAKWAKAERWAEVICTPDWNRVMAVAKEAQDMDMTFKDFAEGIYLVVAATSPKEQDPPPARGELSLWYEYQKDIREGKHDRESILYYFVLGECGEGFG
jgi:hypothetical protein